MTSRPRILRIGTVLADDRFEITDVLGSGGMAVVYLATQLNLMRPVALKVLNDSMARDAGRVERFRREASNASSLDHEHVVPIIDYGDEDGVFWIAMQFIDGETLGDRLYDPDRDPMDCSEALAILTPIAAAIDQAHRQGLIHRDIKPENILLQHRTGKPFLADFGIAKGQGHTSHTAHGELVGTVRYTSPEQIRGEPATAATDIYALAVVAYQVLTGAPGPYAGATVGSHVLHAHLYSEPSPLIGDDQVTAAVYAALARGLAKDPNDRPPSASALIHELATAATDGKALEGRPAFRQQPVLDTNPDEHPGPPEPTAIEETAEIPLTNLAGVRGSPIDIADPTEATPASTTQISLALAELLQEPPIVGAPGNPAAAPTSTADLTTRPESRRPRTRGLRLPRAMKHWPLAIAGGSLALLAAAVLLTDPQRPAQTLPTKHAGAAQISLPLTAFPATSPDSTLQPVGLNAPTAASTTAATAGGQTVALSAINKGRVALAPSRIRGRPDTVRVAGGTARRYETAGGTITIASTPTTVLWLACAPAQQEIACRTATASMKATGEPLRADPQPPIAKAVGDALKTPGTARRDLPLPAHDFDRRRSRALAVAAAYERGTAAMRRSSDANPRDRELFDLAASLAQTAKAYAAIAAAAKDASTSADKQALAALGAADRRTRLTLDRLQKRGYRVTQS